MPSKSPRVRRKWLRRATVSVSSAPTPAFDVIRARNIADGLPKYTEPLRRVVGHRGRRRDLG
jgi:hypothetical protein